MKDTYKTEILSMMRKIDEMDKAEAIEIYKFIYSYILGVFKSKNISKDDWKKDDDMLNYGMVKTLEKFNDLQGKNKALFSLMLSEIRELNQEYYEIAHAFLKAL